ncbi:5,10-methylenetetrahydrofolate reductase [Fulvitalea axinellae]|uniref:Methylenetetrahydrofolate reductase n=1 Tax=Fulvitalea axinellae TaxID=1182444 RepID=A0AAU9CWA3_9BACT|nr:5,10-methylenetetrahydrofolate reductase [Fulvitalea axinellae]
MKITELFDKKGKTFSFEFFPPKSYKATIEFGINVGKLVKSEPDFVSVTYGAGGSNQQASFDLVDYLQNSVGLNTMAHYTCVKASEDKVKADLSYLNEIGINNLMVLRGDPPKGEKNFRPDDEAFRYASDLVKRIKTHDASDNFSLGVAGYPEMHPEAENKIQDALNLKNKVDAGGDFVVTQMFFDNRHYFNFVQRCRDAGITARIIPGIIPITDFRQIKRFAQMSNSDISEETVAFFEPHQGNKKKMYEAGVYYALKQCLELLEGGAPGIHFYTLNKSGATVDIFDSIPKILKK